MGSMIALTDVSPRRANKEIVLTLLGATIFVSAFLLFCSEPMIGKMLLPLLGGVASVWITCLLFFQLVLLAGYVYVYLIERFFDFRAQVFIHSLLMVSAMFFLPMHFVARPDEMAIGQATRWLLIELTKAVGIPFFVTSTTAPLLQNWLTKTTLSAGRDPYFLYALSNGGSLAALVGYPLLIEPQMGVQLQNLLWLAGYVLFALMVMTIAVAALKYRRPLNISPETRPDSGLIPSPSWPDRLYWAFAAFVPSALMLAVTNHILQNLAPVPLLWTIPLAIYLITLMIAFGRSSRISTAVLSRIFPFVFLALFPIVVAGNSLAIRATALMLAGHLFVLFVGALLCHTRLASSRPAPSHLAAFYVWVALGGALGGTFTAIVAPVLFRRIVEYPLLVAMLAMFRTKAEHDELLRGRREWIYPVAFLTAIAILYFGLGERGIRLVTNVSAWLWINAAVVTTLALALRRRFALAFLFAAAGLVYWIKLPARADRATLAAAALFVGLIFLFQQRRWRFASTVAVTTLGYWIALAMPLHSVYQDVYVDRNFFGIKRVLRMGSKWQVFLHGDTLHGMQSLQPQMAGEPLSYFHKTGPIGDVMDMMRDRPSQDIGVVGLGAGTIAAYGNSKRRINFYEIDPEVYFIAQQYFSYLQRCGQFCTVAIGDGRLLVEKADDRKFDLLILDAFNADSVPPHLVSREAIHLYLSKLKPDGLLVFNVTNGYLRLESLVAAVTIDAGLQAMLRYDFDAKPPGKSESAFVVVARRKEDFGTIAQNKNWSLLTETEGVRPWTDDYSNMLAILRWHW
jgi:hypothetical protein